MSNSMGAAFGWLIFIAVVLVCFVPWLVFFFIAIIAIIIAHAMDDEPQHLERSNEVVGTTPAPKRRPN